MYMFKAISMDEEKVYHGYFCSNERKGKIDQEGTNHNINPYTICRNTGVKCEGVWLHEFDLVEYESNFNRMKLVS